VCDVCKKCFESNSKLEDHYRRHTGERPFQCHVCGNKFRYKGDRTKHLKNLHGIYKLTEPASNGTIQECFTPDSMHAKTDEKTAFSASQSSSAASSSAVVSRMELDPPPPPILEPTRKLDPLDVTLSAGNGILPGRLLSCSLPQETVTMSLDDVLQYAQPVADFTFV